MPVELSYLLGLTDGKGVERHIHKVVYLKEHQL